MEYHKDNIGIWITDSYGVKVYLDEKETEYLKQRLDEKETVFEDINISTFAVCAMRPTPEFCIEGVLWIIDRFVVENNAQKITGTTHVSIGRCQMTTTLYNKKTGKKYYGIFLKTGADGFYNLKLVAGE